MCNTRIVQSDNTHSFSPSSVHPYLSLRHFPYPYGSFSALSRITSLLPVLPLTRHPYLTPHSLPCRMKRKR
jgi:hypothetical protein